MTQPKVDKIADFLNRIFAPRVTIYKNICTTEQKISQREMEKVTKTMDKTFKVIDEMFKKL